MRQVLGAACLAALVMAVGCARDGGPSEVEKEFQKLHQKYTSTFHEKMLTRAEQLPPQQIIAEAARTWDSVFGDRTELVRARQEEILRDLPEAPAINEADYIEVSSIKRDPAEEAGEGTVLKQFLWSPVGAAQFALNNWLNRPQLLGSRGFGQRSVLVANASLLWEAVDANPDTPVLMQRQGPLVYIIELERKGDHYQANGIRWLRPPSLGPIPAARPPSRPAPAPTPSTPPPTPPAPDTGAGAEETPAG